MQQPLAHLYFTTVFHHLLSNNFDIAGLVRVASAIASVRFSLSLFLSGKKKYLKLFCFNSKNLQDEKAKDKQVLLYIEQQAVIQAVIQQLARSLSSPELNGISAVCL